MAEPTLPAKVRTLIEQLTLELKKAQSQLRSLKTAQSAPIAIIGMGCRFPGGADSPEALWRVLKEGKDCIREIPETRWGGAELPRENPAVRWAGLLETIEGFDAGFFGMAPREAESLDPQQRLLLEVVWEALEDAGCIPASLMGTRTGVFVGLSSLDYRQRVLGKAIGSLDAYDTTGNMMSTAAGRVSYVLGTQGPSLTIDTACSSSLVAVHMAVQSLRSGESELALAGGANVIVDASTMQMVAQTLALSPDGRCKTFDAGANGFVRGEGCGVVVLKRLADAQRDGDRVCGVILGSAVNQDGRSTGLTAPNVLAQQEMLRQALKNAQVEAEQIGYVETHGTGTALGDPIEVEALKAVLGGKREAGSPCVLGAVKSNLGHLEAAAGIAGLIKAVKCVEKGEIPRNLNFRALNPRIEIEGTGLEIAKEERKWEEGGKVRRAGVSSFGISGTNAHVILEEPPPRPLPTAVAADRPLHLLLLSGKTEAALRAQAARLAEHLARHPEQAFADVCYSAATTRTHFAERLSVVAGSPAEAREKLAAVARGEAPDGTQRGRAELPGPRKPAFLFTGQGAQYVDMGRALIETEPVFRAAIESCAAILDPRMPLPLRSVLYPEPGDRSPIDETAYTQPALFALEYALSQLWQSWGVRPAVVMGHSVGEYVAACLAGVFSLRDGLTLLAERGRLMQALPRKGEMAAVRAGLEQVRRALAGREEEVSIAAVNAPGSVVISGKRESVQAICAELALEGIASTPLTVSHAFHSPQMDPILGALEAAAQNVRYFRPELALISNVTGKLAADEVTQPSYWRRHAREAVQFAEGMQTLAALGVDTLIEVGPHPTLLALGRACIGDAPSFLPSLRKGQDAWAVLLASVGRLWTSGAEIDWVAFDAPYSRQRVPLPTYPFQRERHWIDGPRRPQDERASAGAPLLPFYAPVWRSHAVPWQAPSVASGQWVVLLDEEGLGEQLIRLLEAAGAACVAVPHGRYGQADLSRSARDFWAERLAGGTAIRGVIDCWSASESAGDAHIASETERAERCSRILQRALGHIQSLIQIDGRSRLPLWLVTRGAVSTGPGDPLESVEQAALWGLARVLSSEHPELWGGLVDLPTACGETELAALAAHLLAGDGEDQVALRGQQRHVLRLVRDRDGSSDAPFRPRGTVLLTGGLGAIGLRAARWLAQSGAEHLVLLGRRGLQTPGAEDAAAALRALGVGVTVFAAEVQDPKAMSAVLAHIDAALPPLRAVLHAAGVATQVPLAQLRPEQLDAVLGPKVTGTLVLESLLAGRALDAVVCFSSISAVWGGEGLGGYAAANAFEDAWARQQRARGTPAISIDWGPWAGGGMATAEQLEALAVRGVRSLSPDVSVRMLARVLAAQPEQASAQVIAASIDWPRFRSLTALHGRRPLFDELPAATDAPVAGRSDEARSEGGQSFKARLARSSPAAQKKEVEHQVQSAVAGVLHMAVSAVAMRRPFRELGLDSLMAMELRDRLARAVGAPLPATLAYDHPTVEKLAEWLLGQLDPATSVSSEFLIDGPHQSDSPIAILGMSCRLPGGVDSPEALWELLARGGDAITEIPPERWDVEAYFDPDPEKAGKIYSRFCGTVSEIERFDADFFGISPREAQSMDPQQRVLLEVSWEAIERAGIPPEQLLGSLSGVFVGISGSEYGARLFQKRDAREIDAYAGTGSATSVAAGRVAYLLGLKGPALSVDTACSSSLVSVHLACQSLRDGDCNLALAGGVNLLLSAESTLFASRLQALSPDGRCKAFDASANGFVRSEGCGVVVLKRLADAERDGDPILAVIRGSAVNQDGRSNGLTAPNGPAQQAVIRRALAQAGVAPAQLGYVEAHGTGTALGDPIEMMALGAVLKEGRPAEAPVRIGALKSNLGHAEAAAGVAGLIKTVLVLQHGAIPPNLHFSRPSPHIPWSELPVAVPTAMTPWPAGGQPRIAGVSSFGISGTNAHVVLQEPRTTAVPRPRVVERPLHLLPLSAKTPDALRALAARYAQHLGRHPEVPVADSCFSAATGRSQFDERLVIRTDAAGDARQKLDRIARGESPAQTVRGRAEPSLRPKIAFVFGGGGEPYAGMGRELSETQPVFREALEQCARILQPLCGLTLHALLDPEGDSACADLALFAVEYALSRLWRSWGIEPDAVLGTGVGEYVAACEAGVFSLESGLRLIAADGTRARAEVTLDCQPPVLPLIASATGRVAGAEVASAEYWRGPRRELVGLAEGIAALHTLGVGMFIELGPHPTLREIESAGAGRASDEVMWLPSLRRGESESAVMLDGLARLWVHGVPVDWQRFDAPYARARVLVPTYAWQRQRYWIDVATTPVALPRAPAREAAYALSGRPVEVPGEVLHQVLTLSPSLQPYVAAHTVFDRIVVPGAFHLAVLLAIAADRFGASAVTLKNVQFIAPIFLVREIDLHVSLRPLGEREYSFVVATPGPHGSRGEPRWHPHAEGVLLLGAEAPPASPVLSELLGQCPKRWSREEVIARVAQLHVTWGPEAQTVDALYTGPEASVMQLVALTAAQQREAPLHPSLIDNAFVAGLGALVERGDAGDPVPFLPWSIRELRFHAAPSGATFCYGRPRPELATFAQTMTSDLLLLDAGGQVLATLDGFVCRRAPSEAFLQGAEVLGDWFYDLCWRRETLAASPASSLPGGRWLLLVPDAEAGESLATLLRARGADSVQVTPGACFEQVDASRYRIDPGSAADYAQLLEQVFGEEGDCRGIVHLFSLGTAAAEQTTIHSLERDAQQGCLSVIYLTQALQRHRSKQAPRLWLVTAGAQDLGDASSDDGPPSLAQAPLWGLGRSLAMEHPEYVCTCLDLGPGGGESELSALARELLAGERSQQVALRRTQRYVGHLARLSSQTAGPSASAEIDPAGSYLITGGLGGLGLAAAELLVSQGARHLLLIGRSAPDAAASAVLSRLRSSGALVVTAQADIANHDELASALAAYLQGGPPIKGVLHAAGVIDDGILLEQSAAKLRSVMRPKVQGGFNLHVLTQDQPLDFFVCYSSAAALIGNPGQGNYAAANAFLDALAHHRRRLGRCGTSIGWGPFSQVGLFARGALLGQRHASLGIEALTPEEGNRVLLELLRRPRAHVGVMKFDAQKWFRAFPDLAASPYWRELAATPARPSSATEAGSAVPPRFLDTLAAAAPDERQILLRRRLGEHLARVLGLQLGQVAADKSLVRLGLDSLMAVELRNRLSQDLQFTVPLPLLLQEVSIIQLADYLLERLPGVAGCGLGVTEDEDEIEEGAL